MQEAFPPHPPARPLPQTLPPTRPTAAANHDLPSTPAQSIKSHSLLASPTYLPPQQKKELPPEPESTAADAAQVMVRFPDGSRHTRRFLTSEPFDDVYRWIQVILDPSGGEEAKFVLCNTYPRKDYSDRSQTLADAGLGKGSYTLLLNKSPS